VMKALSHRLVRNCTEDNIMFDPSKMFPKGYHPVQLDRSPDFQGKAKQLSRTERPTRYYFTDLGLSHQYRSRDVLDKPIWGSKSSAPEHGCKVPCNPFYTDIYDLGNLIRKCFINVCTYPDYDPSPLMRG
jgi:hypothetical protein